MIKKKDREQERRGKVEKGAIVEAERREFEIIPTLVDLAKKKEYVIIFLNTNTIGDESELKGIIIDVDNYTIAFLADPGRELLVFKHSIRFIEKVS